MCCPRGKFSRGNFVEEMFTFTKNAITFTCRISSQNKNKIYAVAVRNSSSSHVKDILRQLLLHQKHKRRSCLKADASWNGVGAGQSQEKPFPASAVYCLLLGLRGAAVSDMGDRLCSCQSCGGLGSAVGAAGSELLLGSQRKQTIIKAG